MEGSTYVARGVHRKPGIVCGNGSKPRNDGRGRERRARCWRIVSSVGRSESGVIEERKKGGGKG